MGCGASKKAIFDKSNPGVAAAGQEDRQQDEESLTEKAEMRLKMQYIREWATLAEPVSAKDLHAAAQRLGLKAACIASRPPAYDPKTVHGNSGKHDSATRSQKHNSSSTSREIGRDGDRNSPRREGATDGRESTDVFREGESKSNRGRGAHKSREDGGGEALRSRDGSAVSQGQAKGPNRSRQGSAEAEGGGGAARSTEGSVEAFSVGRPTLSVEGWNDNEPSIGASDATLDGLETKKEEVNRSRTNGALRRVLKQLHEYIMRKPSLQHAFYDFDKNHDNQISLDEFLETCSTMNTQLHTSQLSEVFHAMDHNDDGYISRDEFMKTFEIQPMVNMNRRSSTADDLIAAARERKNEKNARGQLVKSKSMNLQHKFKESDPKTSSNRVQEKHQIEGGMVYKPLTRS